MLNIETMRKSEIESLLPEIVPESDELHVNAAVLETAEPAQLMELVADKKIRRFLLGRISDTAALVDPGMADQLEQALIASGHTPKIANN
jgi:hypothetical protein